MMVKLGHELTDEDLEEAYVDLDVDGDGVISHREFARWYFSGMKPYGAAARNYMKAKGQASKVLGVL